MPMLGLQPNRMQVDPVLGNMLAGLARGAQQGGIQSRMQANDLMSNNLNQALARGAQMAQLGAKLKQAQQQQRSQQFQNMSDAVLGAIINKKRNETQKEVAQTYANARPTKETSPLEAAINAAIGGKSLSEIDALAGASPVLGSQLGLPSKMLGGTAETSDSDDMADVSIGFATREDVFGNPSLEEVARNKLRIAYNDPDTSPNKKNPLRVAYKAVNNGSDAGLEGASTTTQSTTAEPSTPAMYNFGNLLRGIGENMPSRMMNVPSALGQAGMNIALGVTGEPPAAQTPTLEPAPTMQSEASGPPLDENVFYPVESGYRGIAPPSGKLQNAAGMEITTDELQRSGIKYRINDDGTITIVDWSGNSPAGQFLIRK